MNNNVHNERKQGNDKKVRTAHQEVRPAKAKTVRFAAEPVVHEVESYKKYNRDMSNSSGCCTLV